MNKIQAGFLAVSLSLMGQQALAVDVASLAKKKHTAQGLYLTAQGAHELIQQDDQLLFVDVRTRAEVAFLGMAQGVHANVPYMKLSEFYAWDGKKKNFQMELNDEFLTDLEQRVAAKGLDKSGKIVLMCRSGSRSAAAANLLAKVGYTNVYSVVDGFEGDKAKAGDIKGQRVVNGWKNSGLPWSYKLDSDKMYLSAD